MRNTRLLVIAVVAFVAAIVLYVAFRPMTLGSDNGTAKAEQQTATSVVGPEELAPFLTATVTTADLLLRCTDPTPTQSTIAAQMHRDTASRLGLVPDDVEWITEYTYSNTPNASRGYIDGFGDTVQIVIFQLRKIPEPRPISAVLIYAIDAQTGKIEDLNKDGHASQYMERHPGYSTWHCTPVPTPNWTPIPVTQERLATSTPSTWSGVLSPEENETNEVIMAESRRLMKQCFDPTPTPGVLAEQTRRAIAQLHEVSPDHVEVLSEYSYDNSVKDGKRVLEGFGDAVYIVIAQLINLPNNYVGQTYYILATDSNSGRQQDLNVPGGLGAQFDRLRDFGPLRCTPEPTRFVPPIVVTSFAATAEVQTIEAGYPAPVR